VRRWRAGKVEEVVVRLPVLGSYGVTAPFDCAKIEAHSRAGVQSACRKSGETVA